MSRVSDAARSHSTLNDGLILESILVARKNWNSWRNEFERGGGTLLSDPRRFDLFCQEYSVGRTIRVGSRRDLQRRLAADLGEAISDDTGHGLDALEQQLRPKFGTRDGTRCIISVLSKVAAFVRPERFAAWDAYAKKGLNIVFNRPASQPFRTYADYLAAFDSIWRGEEGRKLRRVVMDRAQSAVEKKACFQRRVLDVSLMKIGGRWRA